MRQEGSALTSTVATDKATLRERLRKLRAEHVASLPSGITALLFKRPPAAVLELVPGGAIVGLYRAGKTEAPASAYARFFLEAGHRIALPRIARSGGPMAFAEHLDPFSESDLESGPMGLPQPGAGAAELRPDVLFVPLLGFTERGERIGQGGGHYDRWLAAHPDATAIGLAWDAQQVEQLPVEEHDVALTAIITPTRLYGPF